jgi:hypothetical protein
MSNTSQATFSKQQVPTDISEKALQKPVNSAQLLNCIQMVTTMKAAGISAFFISHFKPSLYG